MNAAVEKYVEAAKLFDQFFDEMPKGQLGKIVCDIGILNDAFLALSAAKQLEKEAGECPDHADGHKFVDCDEHTPTCTCGATQP